MNFEDLLINLNDLKFFILAIILSYSIYYTLNEFSQKIHYLWILVIIYLLYIIIRKIVYHTNVNKSLSDYFVNNNKLKNETYHIDYLNPYITNLDTINFNITKKYNYGNIRTYIKNKLDELLIRKYVKFYDILTFKPYPFNVSEFTLFNDNKTNFFINSSISIQDYNLNTEIYKYKNSSALYLVKGELLKFNAAGYDSNKKSVSMTKLSDTGSNTEIYIYIFEKNDRHIYTKNDNITIINQILDDPFRCTIIDTRDLDYNTEYVCYIQYVKYKSDINLWPNDETFPYTKTLQSLINENPKITPSEIEQYSDIDYSNSDYMKRKNINSTYPPAENLFTYHSDKIDDKTNNSFFKVFPVFIIDKPYINNKKPTHYIQTDNYDTDIKYFNYLKNIYLEFINKQLFSNIKSINFYATKYKTNDVFYDKETHTITKGKDPNKSIDITNIEQVDVEQLNVKFEYMKKDKNKLKIHMYNSLPPVELGNKNTQNIEYPFLIITDTITNKNIIIDLSVTNDNKYNKDKLITIPGYIMNLIGNIKGQKKYDYIFNKINSNENSNYESVKIKNKKTQKDLYLTNEFINTKTVEEYKTKMNIIAEQILDKHFSRNLDSINNISYNFSKLNIVQFDKNLRYNNNNLILNNRYITPQNLPKLYDDIEDVRKAYKNFLKQLLNWENEIDKLTVLPNSNENLLKIVNSVPQSDKAILRGFYKEITKNNPVSGKSNDIYIKVSKDFYKNNLNKRIPYFIRLDLNNNPAKFEKDNIYIVYNIYKEISSKWENIIDLSNQTPSKINKYDKFIDNNDYYLQIYKKPFNKTNSDSINVTSNITRKNKIYICDNNYKQELFANTYATRVEFLPDYTKVKLYFDNIAISFGDDDDSNSNNYTKIEKPDYVTLHLSSQKDITDPTNLNTSNIEKIIDEGSVKCLQNIMYKVESAASTTPTVAASITIQSPHTTHKLHTYTSSDPNIIKNRNIFVNTYKDISKYKKIAYFNRDVVNISNQIIPMDIITKKDLRKDKDSYKKFMKKLVDKIYENEAQLIYYNIPSNIGVNIDNSSAITVYKYTNELFIPYYKRNRQIYQLNDLDKDKLCQKQTNRNIEYLTNMKIHNLNSKTEYITFYKKIFKNAVGLHDDINKECNIYFKSKSSNKNFNLPIVFNKYVTFSNNYMLFYRTDENISDEIGIENQGLPVEIDNVKFDKSFINNKNSNRANTIKTKDYFKNIVNINNIGHYGYTYDVAKNICERIYTVYNKDCDVQYYRDITKDKFNIDNYNLNKKRDKCFNIMFNDKTKKQQEIEEKKGEWIFTPEFVTTTDKDNEVTDITKNVNKHYATINVGKNKASKNIQDLSNLEITPHRLALVNEIKDSVYYNANWNGLGWINEDDHELQGRSNLVQPLRTEKDIINKRHGKLIYYNEDEEPKIKYDPKGAICFGRKFDQTKLSKETKNQFYKFQEEEIIQNIKDIKKYENLSDFSEDRYSRWNVQ